METLKPAEGEDGAGYEPELVHYSTGRLTPGQAAVVDRWRARLLEDKPLPGQDPVPALLRLVGIDDRPRASCSDAVAAAVASLLRSAPPAPMDLARYAEAGRLAAARGGRQAPACQPVSYYLPARPQELPASAGEAGELADVAEQLRADAYGAVLAVHDELHQQAVREFPDDERQRPLWVARQLAERDVPARVRQVPRGAIARMAIDRWARRSADDVAGAAVGYAADVHRQVHRARRDMRQLRPT